MSAVVLALFWVALLTAMAVRPAMLWPLFFAAMAFGSLAVLPPSVTGGVTILPQAMVAVALVGCTLVRPAAIGPAIDAAIDPKRFGLLVAFVLYAVLSALIMPRVFAGQVTIVPLRADGAPTELLWPTSSNLTQAAYLMLSLGVGIATAVFLRRRQSPAVIVRAMCIGGAVLCVTGVVEIAASAAGLSGMLSPFRTASYQIFTDSAVHGMHRAVGLMPEASSFGPLCVKFAAILYFLRSAAGANDVRPAVQTAVTVLLLVMAVLSTSTTAYLGLFVLLVLIAGNWTRRLLSGAVAAPERRRLAGELGIAYCGVTALAAVFLLSPEALGAITGFVDRMVFAKAETSSFDERMLWNSLSLQALADTHGLGVGIGGTRTSSWAVAIVSNSGVIGTLLMVAFLAVCLLRPVPRGDRQWRETAVAAKLAVVVSLAMSSLAGTTTDFGVFNGVLFGMAAAASGRRPPPRLRAGMPRPSQPHPGSQGP